MRHVLLFVSATYFHLLCKIKIFAAKLSGSDLIFDLYSIELFLKLEIQHSDNFAGAFLYHQFFIFIVQAILVDPKDFPLCLKLWIASIFFIQFGSFRFLACQIMHGTDLNFFFHIRHMFLFICAKFSLSAIFCHHFFIVIFSFCAANVYVTLQLMIMVHMLLLYHGS